MYFVSFQGDKITSTYEADEPRSVEDLQVPDGWDERCVRVVGNVLSNVTITETLTSALPLKGYTETQITDGLGNHVDTKYVKVVEREDVELRQALASRDAEMFRHERDSLLQKSDWTQTNDCPLSADKVEEWKVYRQALRDLPANTANVRKPVWPTRPN